ncbi:arsenate reductase-like glutaredoxin family protein [Litoreibacter halocynthiae]|uniref:Arsenate reductase-like glutaredoxin family protein n=1 Tax=Litoreibacter halocynthiae TaxID=1242689 RepID=A0A4R7LGL5_9RHOB|nr:ArsC/Spx/MgsR family protein [Litoreibacter halocynthiae]TDT74863.1 arsenate reductase-like glutaredoxin family protein [Litoreibacter halocynthiae]
MKLYGIKTCDTCRKALKALPNAQFIDVRATPLDRAELQRFLDTFGADLINTRSTTWRGMSDAERAADPLDQLTAHPTLMKRPVIDNGALYLGWNKDLEETLT